jgi:hypothetical protein
VSYARPRRPPFADRPTQYQATSLPVLQMSLPIAVYRPRQRRTLGGIELPRVDQRLVSARRFRALVDAFERELDAGGQLSVADQALIKQAANLVLAAERLQADIAKGEPVDADALVRVSSEARRAVSAIRSKAAKNKPHQDPLTAHIAAKYGKPTDNDVDETAAAQ